MLKVEHLLKRTGVPRLKHSASNWELGGNTWRAKEKCIPEDREVHTIPDRNSNISKKEKKKDLKGKKSCRTQMGNKKKMQMKWTALLKGAAVLCGRNMIMEGIKRHINESGFTEGWKHGRRLPFHYLEAVIGAHIIWLSKQTHCCTF